MIFHLIRLTFIHSHGPKNLQYQTGRDYQCLNDPFKVGIKLNHMMVASLVL